jgi:radical SAM superfamily enzyme YgiQ (UPF0313 family)
MHYEGNIIRPPSEANSILLQATVGCSHNKCTFCGTYAEERFRIKDDATILKDIAFAAQHCRRQRRLFICDGDALIIPQKRLQTILSEIKRQLPWVTRVGVYGNAKSIKMKSLNDLIALKNQGIGIIYMGLESGDNQTLKAINKGVKAETMIQMGRKVRQAQIKLSITAILGIAGKKRSLVHAEQTGKVLSAIDPDYIGILSLMLLPGTPMFAKYQAGAFELLNPLEMLQELKAILTHTDLTRGLFHANHASNYLPIKARLPKDKSATLALIDRAIASRVDLKPEWLRAL